MDHSQNRLTDRSLCLALVASRGGVCDGEKSPWVNVVHGMRGPKCGRLGETNATTGREMDVVDGVNERNGRNGFPTMHGLGFGSMDWMSEMSGLGDGMGELDGLDAREEIRIVMEMHATHGVSGANGK